MDDGSRSELCANYLQAIANHGYLDEEKALSILTPIWLKFEESNPTKEDLKNVIKEINSKISNFDQEIKKFTHEGIEKSFFVFTNLAENDANKFQQQFTVAERELFRRILNHLVVTEGFVTNWTSARNCISDKKNVSRRDTITELRYAELLKDWTAIGYFYHDNDKVHLGVKAFLEFDGYFREMFPNKILMCSLCQTTTYWGVPCLKCQCKFHKTCLRKYFKKKNAKCPSCKEPWSTPLT